MKKKFSFAALFTCMLAGVLALALVGCGNSGSSDSGDAAKADSYTLVKDGTLTCVSELGFAPFEYLEAGSTDPIGYDIDVANEIASRMGLECEFLPSQDFDSLVPTVKEGGKADIAIAGITINDERKKEVDFSDPYFESNLAIVVKADSSEDGTTLDAEGKQIACQTGTTGDAYVDENMPQATKVPLTDISAGLTGVSTGKFDAYVIDLPVARKNLKDAFTDLKIAEEIATGEEYGIVVSKDNPALTEAINKQLAEMKSDGTLQKIWDKWMVDTDVPEE